MARVDLSSYNNDWYNPGSAFRRIAWYLVSGLFFETALFPASRIKLIILRAFGASVGIGVVLKPRVQIKYPWHFKCGDHVWIGEGVWIDNLAQVELGNHVCISQGAMLLTGNHNFRKSTFDLMVKPIRLEDGVWVGAKSIVCPGVSMQSHSILTVGSVASDNTEPYAIYRGNPAQKVGERSIE
jgi:putative colanic acid biosynthesis acetyltransferase WcaF